MFADSDQALLTTKLGKILGKIGHSSNGTSYVAYYNIPYAEVPVGKLRFKAPQPAKSWTGVLDATVESDECYSKHQFYLNRIGSEDCLKLNVFTKATGKSKSQSVMVFIHGGGFVMGSSKVEVYGPDYFMCEDVILITINYRLGIFGFLALQDKSLRVPGNAGLKDQIMALKWIQDNIACYGGDPNNVTVFGSSAGSASINYMLCSPMAKGLFHKVIMQSGSALNPWARGKGLPEEILQYFNLEGRSDHEILDKLMNCTKEELLDVQNHCHDPAGACDMEAFGPIIEGPNPFESSFLLDEPLTIMRSGNYLKVPMIIGYNTHEGLLFDAMEQKYNIDLTITNFEHTVPWMYNLSSRKVIINTIAAKIKDFYFNLNDPMLRENKNQYVELQTDNFFLRGVYVTLKTIQETNSCPIYLYRFDFDGNLNGFKRVFNVSAPGTCHGDEIFYMFKTSIMPDVGQNTIESKTITRIVKMWSQFAKTSDPNPLATEKLFDVHWPQTDGKKLLNIGQKLQVMHFPECRRMSFWDELDVMVKL